MDRDGVECDGVEILALFFNIHIKVQIMEDSYDPTEKCHPNVCLHSKQFKKSMD